MSENFAVFQCHRKNLRYHKTHSSDIFRGDTTGKKVFVFLMAFTYDLFKFLFHKKVFIGLGR